MAATPTGRGDEPSEAQRFLDGIGDGSRALVIQGEAGIGKTTLLDATLEAAKARGHGILVARAVEAEAGLAYAALGDLLRPYLDAVRDLAPPQRRALEIALLLAEDPVGSSDRQAVALAVLGVLRSLAEARPVVVAVDDAPWLDRPSAAALAFVARRLGASPVALVVSARQAPGATAPLALGAAFSGERLRVVTPPPMSLGATQHLLRRRIDLVLPRPTLHRLHELAAGNPFFALELGRAYLSGTVRLDRGERLPVTLQALVADRLAVLTPRARRAAAAAAAMAQPTGALVAAVAGRAPLAELERAGIVELHDGRVRFSHPLLASAAYSAVDAAQRRAIHATVAGEVRDAEERARHLALAVSAPDAGVAGLLDAAAAQADARGAPAAAADLYARAARLTPADADAEARRRRVAAAFCLFQSGDSAGAREELESIVAALGPGPDRARALVRLARVRSYDDDLRAAESVFRRAIAESGDDRELRAVAQEGVAALLFRLRERLSEAVEHATSAAMSQDVGVRAEALGSRLLAESALGRPEAATTLAAALALQRHCEHRRTLAQPLFPAAVVWLWLDDLERARAALRGLYDAARERGEESSLPYLLVMLAQVACVEGDFGAAIRLAGEGYGLTEQGGQAALGAYLLALRALAGASGADPDRAQAEARMAIRLAERTRGGPAEQFARAALGLLYLARGQAEPAAEALRGQVQRIRDEQITEPGAARFVADHIEALIELGDTTEATELLEWYEGNATRLGRSSALALAARCRGLLAAAAGDPIAALKDLERALVLHESARIPLDRARTLLALGVTHRRAKHKRAARDALDAAAVVFERLGADAWLARLAKERARIGGRGPAGVVLTPTEQRVADLVSEGLATKQVAAALFVSPKTVEGHLSRIYAKLGVHSRTELARRLTAAPPPQ